MAKKIRRRAIIVRTPIILNAPTFHTIAAHSDKYENAHTMGVYPDLETARNYINQVIRILLTESTERLRSIREPLSTTKTASISFIQM